MDFWSEIPQNDRTASRTSSSAPGHRCAYTPSVVAGDECPNTRCTTDTLTPDSISLEA